MAKKNGILVGRMSEFHDGDSKIVGDGSSEIGVYFINGAWYAYRNFCPHQGGPACEGLTMAKVEQIIEEDKTCSGLRFNHDEQHIVCPWHGWEFRMEDGVSSADKSDRLQKFDVELRGEEVYVLA